MENWRSRNRLFRENHARDCQEIEELRRVCCEETDRARQARIDELSVHQERNPLTVSPLLAQFQDLHNKVIPLSHAREFFRILKQRAASGATHVPSQPSTESQDHALPRFWIEPRDTRNIVGTSGNVSERLPARERRTSTLFENSKNVATSSHELRPDIPGNTKRSERKMRREPQNSSIPAPRFQRGAGVSDYTGATNSN